MRRMLIQLAALGVAGLAVLSPAAAEQPLKKVAVVGFPGGDLWPIFVARKKGFFADNGLDVELIFTPGSKFQMTGLIDGEFDIAVTAMDNVVAYSEGQGAPPTKKQPDIAAFMGLNSGFLSLVATPDIKTYADLRGKRLGVDAMTTGYAFVLRKMMQLNGVGINEVKVIEAGGVKDRFEALMKKEIDATLVVSPLEAAAKRAGYTVLGSGVDSVGSYLGVVSAARRGWMVDNKEAVVGYIRAIQTSMNWLYETKNRDEAINILGESAPAMAGPVGEAAYKIMVDRENGFYPDLAISVPGLETVLRLRSEYADERRELTDTSKYIDTSYHQEAKQ